MVYQMDKGICQRKSDLPEKRDVAKIVGCWKRGQSVKRVVAGKVEEKNNSLIFIY